MRQVDGSPRMPSLRFRGTPPSTSQPARLPQDVLLPEQKKAQELYGDLVNVKAFVKGRDNTRDDFDKAPGTVELRGVTQPLSEPFQRFVAHVRTVHAKSHSDGVMTIEAGRSSFHGQPAWPARTFEVRPNGDAQIREGNFVVDYNVADNQLYYRQTGNG
jgi:hypothetical protein